MQDNNKEFEKEFKKEFNAMMTNFYSDQSPDFKALKKSIQSFCKKHFNTIDEISIKDFLKALEALKEKKNFSQEEVAAKISIFFNSLENAKGKKIEKISLWRRFVNFILSLFRSNPKSSQTHHVVAETAEEKEEKVEEIAQLSVSQEIDRLAEALKRAMEEDRLSQAEDSEQGEEEEEEEEEEEGTDSTISNLDSSFDSDSVFSFEVESDATELERLLLDKSSLLPQAQEIIFRKLALALAGEFPPQLEDSGYERDTESNGFTEENAQAVDATELKRLLADESNLLSVTVKDFIFKYLCLYLSETSEQVANEAESMAPDLTDIPLETLISRLIEMPADIYTEILKQIPDVIYAEIYSEIYSEIQAEYSLASESQLFSETETAPVSDTTESEKEVTPEVMPETKVPVDTEIVPTSDSKINDEEDLKSQVPLETSTATADESELPASSKKTADEPASIIQTVDRQEKQSEHESLFKKCVIRNKVSESDSFMTASTSDTDELADAFAAMAIVAEADLKSQVQRETLTLTTSASKNAPQAINALQALSSGVPDILQVHKKAVDEPDSIIQTVGNKRTKPQSSSLFKKCAKRASKVDRFVSGLFAPNKKEGVVMEKPDNNHSEVVYRL